MKKDEHIEDLMNSLEGMDRAAMPPFFFTRLQARMNRLETPRVKWLVTKPAVAMVTLSCFVLMNIITIDYLLKHTDSHVAPQNGLQQFAQEYDLAAGGDYQSQIMIK